MYIDANFFVFASCDAGVKGTAAREILSRIVSGKPAITSVLALDEVMWVLRKNKQQSLTREIIEDIYATPNLQVVSAPGDVALSALQHMEKHNLKPRDALHLATMLLHEETSIITDDEDFARIPGITRIGF